MTYKWMLSMTGLAFLFAHSKPASAQITFLCQAGAGTECAFSVIKDTLITNFVLGPGKTFSVGDNYAGGRYCVVVSRPRPQIKNWPGGTCINALDGRPGKVVVSLRARATYS